VFGGKRVRKKRYSLALVGPLAVAVEAAREALGARAVLALPAGQTHDVALRAAGVVSELVVARLAQHLAPVPEVVGAAGHAVLVVQRRVAVREHGRRVRRAHVHALLLRVPRQQPTLTYFNTQNAQNPNEKLCQDEDSATPLFIT
jgi:hypothetical protein